MDPLMVAVASENDAYDGRVYARLLSLLLGREIAQWKSEMRITGHRRVTGLAEPFLRRAADDSVRHALLAVDNDGGSVRGPEHEKTHDRLTQAADKDGCRVCRVLAAIPDWWVGDERRYCAVVPVQTLETWLLWARGDNFEGAPERTYDRWLLKKRFFGKPLPPEAERAEVALAVLDSVGAIDRLRERPSFRLFEEMVAVWR